MTFPNNPGPEQRRALRDKVGNKGWIFGGIIVLVAALLVFAFTWAGNDNSASNPSNAPTATTGAGGSPNTGSRAPAAPPRRGP